MKAEPKPLPGAKFKNSAHAAAMQAMADPVVRSRFIDLGQEIFPRERQTPEALGALVKADAEKWWPIIKATGIKGE